ncbi:MAG: helix-turn-helix domain-containing protein [Acetatifactor sp.]
MNLGNKIKLLRLKAGATQEMLAGELGVSCQSISKWENDVCAPDITLLPKISEFFGVTIDELFDLSVDQKLHRIENMLDYETELSDADFRETERFLTEQLETYDVTHPDRPNGRIYSFLAHLYHHRITSDSKKVSEYARRAMRLSPEIKEDQWLLQASEGAAIADWNCRNHNKTILFFKELVANHPEISRNYLYLMDNLLLDHRTVETKEYLDIYRTLNDRKDFQIPVYEARIALAEHRPKDAEAILAQMEETYPDDPWVLFELAGFSADACKYDEAISYYERSYAAEKTRPRYIDALQGEAIVYEIQGKYEDALLCLERIKKNLAEEWGITEGASVLEIEKEKQRILNFNDKFR